MLKEVKRYEWESFCLALKDYYDRTGCDLKFAMTRSGEGFGNFTVTRRDNGTRRTIDTAGAYREIAGILFPDQTVSVVSVYKPKGFLGAEHIYVALEPPKETTD